MSNPAPFDCSAAFRLEIEPHLKHIMQVCEKHRIPMVAGFLVKRGEAEADGRQKLGTQLCSLQWGDRNYDRHIMARQIIAGEK